MPSALVQRFLDSMSVTFEMWHDGVGYDLEALRDMAPEERGEVEAVLVEHLRSEADWRDVEALWALSTPRARRCVRSARKHAQADVRNCALRCTSGERMSRQTASAVEAGVVRSIESAEAMANLATTLDLAEQHPTPRVKRALLERCRTGDATTRVNCAALLLYLCGQAPEPFDWTQRPLFLRFSTEDQAELLAAWNELKDRVAL